MTGWDQPFDRLRVTGGVGTQMTRMLGNADWRGFFLLWAVVLGQAQGDKVEEWWLGVVLGWWWRFFLRQEDKIDTWGLEGRVIERKWKTPF